jgi:hypothetical protein
MERRLPTKRHLDGAQCIINKYAKYQDNETFVVCTEKNEKTVFSLDLIVTRENFLQLKVMLRVAAEDEWRQLKETVFRNRYSNIVEILMEQSSPPLLPGTTFTCTLYVEKCSLNQ